MLVAGYDGSAQSRDALVLTRVLAPALGADVLVVSVVTFAPTETTYDVYERLVREEGERLQAEARALLDEIPGVQTKALPGVSPPRELHDLAEGRGARLIVVGSTHRSRLGRVLPGTVADRLLAAAPCPVAVAPRAYSESDRSLESIVVAFDGSAESKLALALAAEIANAVRANVGLIAVVSPPEALVGPAGWAWRGVVVPAEAIESDRRRIQADVEAARRSIPDDLRGAGEIVVDPDPGSAIVMASEEADLLIMGSRGYGPVGRVLLGSVSAAVLRHAACPVIVTPRSIVAEEP
jgi:nucleotide-binding universal stress UspA family protein